MERNQNSIEIPKEFFEKRFSDFITDGFILFKDNFGKIFPIYLFISIIFIVATSFLLTDIDYAALQTAEAMLSIYDNLGADITDEQLEQMMNLMMAAIIPLILSLFLSLSFSLLSEFTAYGMVGGFLYKSYLKQDVDFSEEIGASFRKELFIIPVLLALLIPIGLILLIPGLIMYIFWIFAPSMHTIESTENLQGLKASAKYSKGNFWRILAVFLINVIVTSIVSIIVSFILDFVPTEAYGTAVSPATRNYVIIILYQLLFSITNIVLSPLLGCLLTTTLVYCKTQRVRRESGAQYYPSTPSYAQPYPQITPTDTSEAISDDRSEEIVYCPYCGFSMDKKMNFRFCPSCGGKILK